jgi:MFS family permease
MMVPYQIAYGPLSNIIILYILQINGTVVDASYAVAVSNIMWIAASAFWGRMVEIYDKRKIFVASSLLGLAISLAGIALIKNVLGVIIIYGILTFMVIANSMPFNMLIMETNPKDRWAHGFSRLQMLSTIGVVFGYVITAFLSGFLPLDYVILMLVPFSIIALIFTKFIHEPTSPFPKLSILSSIQVLGGRFLSNPLLFIKIPGFARRGNASSTNLSASQPILKKGEYINNLYIAVLVFFIGSTIFNTAFPAGLTAQGFSNSDVLSVLLVGNIVQAVIFYKSGMLIEKRVKSKVASSALMVRGLGYISVGISFILLTNIALLGASVILYTIAAGIAYAIFYATFNTMVFEAVGNEKRGTKLGIYSGFVGFGSFVGAPIAGYLSYYIGYWFAFMAAGAFIIATAGVILLGRKSAK